MTAVALRLILVEDSDDDVMLITRQLRRHPVGVEIERVTELDELRAVLRTGHWDAVISDYNLNGFDGLAALEVVREQPRRIPFILVSNAVGEDIAVAAMRAGASDYLMKGRLARLLPAVEREVREARDRRDQEGRIARLARMRAVSAAVNAAMLRARERTELCREACRIVVEHGGFAMAWIGTWSPALATLCGFGIPDTFDPASCLQRASEMALHEGRATLWNDVDREAPPSDAARLATLGIGSVVVLPLAAQEGFCGVLALFAREPGTFDEEELRLLREVSADIVFTLDHIGQRQRLDHLAFFDPVTDLANRKLFGERLGQLLEGARRAGQQAAVAVVDIERFAEVNATFGRHVGDALLRGAGGRLAALYGKDNVARIGADEFGIAVGGLTGEGDAARGLREGAGQAFELPLEYEGQPVKLAARIGAALFPADGADAGVLLRNAEAAMARAKAVGEPVLFYNVAMTTRLAGRLLLEAQLRRALERGEFELHYQPKVRASSRRIVGAEALLRWRSPDLGMVSPVRFVPMLEETGLIVEVGDWAMRTAAAEVRRWRSFTGDAPRCAVNVSMRQLQRADFVRRVARTLGAGDAEIELEIVESLAMADPEGCIAKLVEVNGLGVRVFIDDFGTGHSSLAYLARLPVQGLKIDRSFTAAMLGDRQARTLVATIVALSHSLGLDIVAEGVETEEQAEALREMGCGELQGYLTGRPMPAKAFGAALAANREVRREVSGFP